MTDQAAENRAALARIASGDMRDADVMRIAAAFDRSGVDPETMDADRIGLAHAAFARRTAIILADPVLIAFTALAEEEGDPDLLISRRLTMLPDGDQPHGVEQIMLHADDDLAFEREPILAFVIPTGGMAMGMLEDLCDAAREWRCRTDADGSPSVGEAWDARREGSVVRLRMEVRAIPQDLFEGDPEPEHDYTNGYLAEILADVAGGHTRARIARLAHAHGVTTVGDLAKLDGIERMSVEGRIVEALEDKAGIGHAGPLGSRVAMLEQVLGLPVLAA